MFSLLLAEVAGHATEATSEAASGLTKITEQFGISVPSVIAQILSFSVVAFVLYKFGFKPVLATIAERQEKIESGLKYAEDMKAQLATAQQENANILKAAQVESGKIIDEARKAAKEFADKMQAEAVERANAQMAKAQQAIELEQKKMLADARTEIARLVVATTEQVLAKKLSDSDRASYNETAAKELTTI